MHCTGCGGKFESSDTVFCVSCGLRRIKTKPALKTEKEIITFYFKQMEKKHGVSMSLRALETRLKEYNLKKSTNNHHQVRQIIRTEVVGPSSQCGYRNMWNKLRTTYGINIPRDAVMNILR